jgi:hypothetical protein
MSLNKIFADFDNADPTSGSGGGEYISAPGSHLVEIQAVKLKESDTTDKIFLIVEFKILETNAADLGVRVGHTYAWVHNMLNKFFGASNTKQFVAAALGMEAKSPEAKAVNRAAVEEAWSDTQPLAGETLQLRTANKTTKNGNPFTTHTWGPTE